MEEHRTNTLESHKN